MRGRGRLTSRLTRRPKRDDLTASTDPQRGARIAPYSLPENILQFDLRCVPAPCGALKMPGSAVQIRLCPPPLTHRERKGLWHKRESHRLHAV